jgi:hypothetical protein
MVGYHCLCRHLLRPVFNNDIINDDITATSSANEWYVRRAPIYLFIMFCEYMLSYCLFSFIMLFSTSSIFELHMLVANVVMFNILKLILEVMHNYLT